MVEALYNSSGIIGIILNAGTESITGTLVVTLLFIILMMFAVTILFQIPLEYTAILILPLVLVISAFQGQFYVLFIVLIMYLSIIIAKTFIFR